MFLRSIKEINRLISKGMSNFSLNSSYWEKERFSKLRLFNFKKFVSRSVLASSNADIIELKNLLLQLKNKGLGKNCARLLLFMYSFWNISFLTELYHFFSCEKTLLNITFNEKTLLSKSFFISDIMVEDFWVILKTWVIQKA